MKGLIDSLSDDFMKNSPHEISRKINKKVLSIERPRFGSRILVSLSELEN